jgi:hypothetical protein
MADPISTGGKAYAPRAAHRSSPVQSTPAPSSDVDNSSLSSKLDSELAGRAEPTPTLDLIDPVQGEHFAAISEIVDRLGESFSSMQRAARDLELDLAGDTEIDFVPEVFRSVMSTALTTGSAVIAAAVVDGLIGAAGGPAGIFAGMAAGGAAALVGALRGGMNTAIRATIDGSTRDWARAAPATWVGDFCRSHESLLADASLDARAAIRRQLVDASPDAIARMRRSVSTANEVVRDQYYARLAAAWAEYKGRVAGAGMPVLTPTSQVGQAVAEVTGPRLAIARGGRIDAEVKLTERGAVATRLTAPELPSRVLEHIGERTVAEAGFAVHYVGAGFEFDTDRDGRVRGLVGADAVLDLLRVRGGGAPTPTRGPLDLEQTQNAAIVIAETSVRGHPFNHLEFR